MEFVLFWLVFAVLVGLLAVKRGRGGVAWFFVAVLLSPLIGALLLLVLPNKAEVGATPTPETHVKCPECRELVLKDARKCKHCGSALVPQ